MRTLMTFLTLGAAGAGYVYLQQTPTAAEPYSTQAIEPTLFDWNRSTQLRTDAPRVPMKELVYRVREKTRSALDEFVSQNRGRLTSGPLNELVQKPVNHPRRAGINSGRPGGVNAASSGNASVESSGALANPTLGTPGDAFQRLKSAAQTITDASVASSGGWDSDLSQRPRTIRRQLPNAMELQRIAFEPPVETGTPAEPVSEQHQQPFIGTASAGVDRPLPKPDRHPDEPGGRTSVSAESTTNGNSPGQSKAAIPGQTPNIATLDLSTADGVKADSPVSAVSQKTAKSSATADMNCGPDGCRIETKSRRNRSAQTVVRKTPVAAEWKVVGKTTEGLPMHAMHLGDGGTRTLVIAGLSGTDPTAVRWLELLAEETARHPDLLETNEIVFFRAGNPDGLVHRTSNA